VQTDLLALHLACIARHKTCTTQGGT